MKCTKCGNEFSGERFCPVCGYPVELYSRKSDERRKYASQFSDGYDDLDPSEETNKIIDHATRAQRYDAQFSSDYSQLLKEYEKDIDNTTSSNKSVEDTEVNNDTFEEISSKSSDNLSSYEDSFEGEEEKEKEQSPKSSKTPVVVILVIVILALLGGVAWIVADTMGVNPFTNNTATEPTADTLSTDVATQVQSQLNGEMPTDTTPVPTAPQPVAPIETETAPATEVEINTEAVTDVVTEAPTDYEEYPTMSPPMPPPMTTDAPTEQATDTAVVFPDDFVDEDNDGYDDNTDIYYGFQ